MSVILTYTELLSRAQSYLERGTPSDATVFDALPDIINRAERIIGREVKLLLMCVPAISALVINESKIAKPARWRETISINYGAGLTQNVRTFIFPRNYEYIRSIFPDDTVVGAPQYYADYDYQHYLIGPTPDAAYPFEIMYYANPDYLTPENQTNWWSEYAPELLQSKVFAEIGLFLKDNEMFGLWDAQYKELLAATNNEDQEKSVDRTTVRRSA
jgi:hypothetical protein